MEPVYMDKYHFFNKTIMPKSPVVCKIGVVGFDDLNTLKAMYPGAKIVLYEADPANFAAAKDGAKKIGAKLYNNALAPAPGPVRINRYTNVVSNSMFDRHTHDKNCKLVEVNEVPGITMKQICGRFPTKHIDLLILNCEGAEIYALEDMVDLECIDQCCVGFHCQKVYPVKTRDDLLEKLRPKYHVINGKTTVPGGIPDYLLIRRV